MPLARRAVSFRFSVFSSVRCSGKIEMIHRTPHRARLSGLLFNLRLFDALLFFSAAVRRFDEELSDKMCHSGQANCR